MCNWIQSKLYMTLAAISDQKRKSDHESFLGSWSKGVGRWMGILSSATHKGTFRQWGIKTHFRTMSRLIWKTIKNAQGYGVGEEEIVSER